MRWRIGLALAGALLAAGCSKDPAVSDTGYRGTWTRQNGRLRPIIAIWPAPDGDGRWLFRLTQDSDDARIRETCDWEGNCVERDRALKVAEIKYMVSVDPATKHLIVSYVETRYDQGTTPTTFTQEDEFVVQPGGTLLLAKTRERNGQRYGESSPVREFVKVSDSVAFPPEAPRR